MIKQIILRFFSRKESNTVHDINFEFGKVDPRIKEKVNSAKVITLAELEEM